MNRIRAYQDATNTRIYTIFIERLVVDFFNTENEKKLYVYECVTNLMVIDYVFLFPMLPVENTSHNMDLETGSKKVGGETIIIHFLEKTEGHTFRNTRETTDFYLFFS